MDTCGMWSFDPGSGLAACPIVVQMQMRRSRAATTRRLDFSCLEPEAISVGLSFFLSRLYLMSDDVK